ncbi:hypothetical protein HZA87_03335 [Candidatus Uhrbacteria bacterium]|nr:hypothetical protein [Candidatus Uhrbacteria bacterium]
MLTDRFPFLSLVPKAVLADHLLDGSHVRVRATLTQTKPNTFTFELTPQTTQASRIQEPLRGTSVSNMITGISYSVEMDESGAVSSFMAGKPMRDTPAPIENILNRSHAQLLDLARTYAEELETLPPVQLSRECMRSNVAIYLNLLQQTDTFSRAFGPPPRVRALCMGCFQREMGEPVSLQTQTNNGWQFVTTSIVASERLFHALHVCLGEPFGPDVMPIFVLIPHEQLVFPGAYFRLYEAGMHTCLEGVYQDERTIFLGSLVGARQGPVES